MDQHTIQSTLPQTMSQQQETQVLFGAKTKKIANYLLVFFVVFNIGIMALLVYIDSLYTIDSGLKDNIRNFGKLLIDYDIRDFLIRIHGQFTLFGYAYIFLVMFATCIIRFSKKQKLVKGWVAKHIALFLIIGILSLIVSYITNLTKKPAIYLYPTHTQDISVKVDFMGIITKSSPKYNNGWHVTAHSDGKLINIENRKEYQYLFWEGFFIKQPKWNFTKGAVIKGEDTGQFLRNKLSEIGLNKEEYDEFILYWEPQLRKSEYNFIHFSTDQYAKAVPLKIEPQPESILRVQMLYKPLKNADEIKPLAPQVFDGFERNGFTVIEWGGMRTK